MKLIYPFFVKFLSKLSSSTLTFGFLFLTSFSMAQNYPVKPVTIVVPFAAGGPTDAVARMIAVPMTQFLGQTVIVENTAGAGGTIGANRVAKANPDGYMIFLHHVGMSTAPALYPKLPYDPVNDFEFIGQVVDVPLTLIARKNIPANNFKELEAYLKKNQEKVTMGNAGPGAVSQLCSMLFTNKMGIKLTEVPYKGTGPAMTDLLGGTIDIMCDQTTNTVANIRADKLKVFGTTTLKRLKSLPNIPTLDEQGFKGFEVVAWHGLYAPKGTPPAVMEKLNAALKNALANSEIKARLADLSVEEASAENVSASGLKKQLESEIKRWTPIIKAAGVTAD